MKRVNLIPAPRLIARQRRAHLRRCAAGCAVWAVVSVAAAGVARAMWTAPGDAEADERLAAVAEDVERTERAIAATGAQLAAAQSTLRANQAIASQPDWSVLLAVLAREIKDDVVLKSCHVHPAGSTAGRRSEARRAPAAQAAPGAAGAAGANAPETPPFVLEANGTARTLAAAHRFVSDLERTGLFARVTLLDTTREVYLTEGAIAFRLECSLDDPAAGAPGALSPRTSTAPGAHAAVDRR
jgi:hypothetical protein